MHAKKKGMEYFISIVSYISRNNVFHCILVSHIYACCAIQWSIEIIRIKFSWKLEFPFLDQFADFHFTWIFCDLLSINIEGINLKSAFSRVNWHQRCLFIIHSIWEKISSCDFSIGYLLFFPCVYHDIFCTEAIFLYRCFTKVYEMLLYIYMYVNTFISLFDHFLCERQYFW